MQSPGRGRRDALVLVHLESTGQTKNPFDARFLTDPPPVAGVSDFKHVREVWRSLRTSAIDRCSQGGPREQLTLELTSEVLVVKWVRLH